MKAHNRASGPVSGNSYPKASRASWVEDEDVRQRRKSII